MKKVSLLLLLLFAITFFHLLSAQKLVVETTEGRYLGKQVATGAYAYLGIPFARPPVGNLRWKKAVPPKKFKGVRNALVSGDCCWQSGIFKNVTVAQTEDCLTLDIYASNITRKQNNLQVRVYIHGGGFAANNAAIFPGDQLAQDFNCIVVIINYRLSYQGFMVLSPLITEGRGTVNYGITDQQRALQWIQANIAQFGGDPKNVVIFGNSAGGMSVLMHYTFPSSKNLFKVGVSESAGPWNYITAQSAASLNDPLTARFGCYDSTKAKVNMTCMRNVPIASIYNYSWALAQPCFDKLFPRPISKTFGNPKLMKQAKGGFPIIVGDAKYEGNQFAYLAMRIVTQNSHPELNTTYQQYKSILNNSLPFNDSVVQSVINYYQNLSENGNYFIPLREALGDYGIKCGVARTTQTATNGLNADVYNYHFLHNTEKWRYTFLNATHTVEIPYVLMGNGTLFEAVLNDNEKLLAQRIVRYIGNLLQKGDPNGNNLPNWPVFKLLKDTTLAWDLPLNVISQPVPASCGAIWNKLTVEQVLSPDQRSSSSSSSSWEKVLSKKFINIFH